MVKTNVMRLLTQAGIEYSTREYPVDENDLSGVHVANVLGLPPEEVFKTLVTVGPKGEHFVFVIPVAEELNLKKAAKAAGVKSIEMIKMKDLLPLTGYIRGGCSPIGMKKPFPTFMDETAILFDTVSVSAGQRGTQVVLNAEDLMNYVGGSFADLV